MTELPWLRTYPAEIRWDMAIEPKPLYSLIDEAAQRFRDRAAIDFLGKIYTFGKLAHMIDLAAAGFQKLGVARGVNVGLFLPNCPQQIICYFGILKAGGTVVNFSALYSESELRDQIEDSQTHIMVTLALNALYPKMNGLLDKSGLQKLVVGTLQEALPFPQNILFPIVKRGDVAAVDWDERHISFADLIDNDADYKILPVDPVNDVAVLQYTGGTTGTPKGAMLTHANLHANTEQANAMCVGLAAGQERMMGVLPFFHVFAMTAVMLCAIRIGATIILQPRFDLDMVMKAIRTKKPTIFHGVPTMFNAIARHPLAGVYDMRSIKTCVSGGAPLPLEVKNAFERLTGATVREGYGLSETSPIVCINPMTGINKPGSIGIPVPRTRIIIVDQEDSSRELPQGESGEIAVEGPQVMKGYWNRPAETAEVLRNGRLLTGDVGYLDADGYTFIVDRKKDIIMRGGFKIYPRHVEEAIYEFPGVREVIVIGIPDSYLGEAPKAFVSFKEGVTPPPVAELLAFLKDRVGKSEVPTEIEYRDALPKTMVGKLSKKELAAEERAKRTQV